MYSKSVIYGSGYLNRIKLKQSEGYIYGYLSIKTSSNNIVSFNVYQPETTKSGKVNPAYKGLITVMNEYKDATTGNPDYVEIQLNDKYPNAEIYKRDNVQKSLKFIHRTKPTDSKIVFKMYGLRVDKIDGNDLVCSSLSYNKKIYKINFVSKEKLEVGNIVDLVGYVREGIENGNPIDELRVKKSRISELEIDFDSGIEEMTDVSPF